LVLQSDHRCRLGKEFGETEVQNLYIPVVTNDDVFRFEVAMDDPGFMSGANAPAV
jgi:hypothetical protein